MRYGGGAARAGHRTACACVQGGAAYGTGCPQSRMHEKAGGQTRGQLLSFLVRTIVQSEHKHKLIICVRCKPPAVARDAGRKGRGPRRRDRPPPGGPVRSAGMNSVLSSSLGLRPSFATERTVTFIPEPNGPARQAAGDHVASAPGRARCGMIGGVATESAIIGRHGRQATRRRR